MKYKKQEQIIDKYKKEIIILNLFIDQSLIICNILFLWFQPQAEHLQISNNLISIIGKFVNSWKPDHIKVIRSP